MKYAQTKESSAEILRLVIPEMAKHEAAYHPYSYAVWYEAIGGINQDLKRAIDVHLSTGTKLDDEKVSKLYESHVVEREKEHQAHVQNELQNLVKELIHVVHSSHSTTEQYSSSLERYEDSISTAANPTDLKQIIQSLIEETKEMRTCVASLHQELEDRASQIDTLQSSLSQALGEALVDPLTGLLNRRGFDKAIEEIFGTDDSGRTTLSLILVDIDHFKKINDTYGHLFGDKVIKGLGELLESGVKSRGNVGRFGGEEFAVVLPKTNSQSACAVAENLRAVMERTAFPQGNGKPNVNATISLGVTEYHPGESIEAWFNRADEALYASKRGGRNRVTLQA